MVVVDPLDGTARLAQPRVLQACGGALAPVGLGTVNTVDLPLRGGRGGRCRSRRGRGRPRHWRDPCFRTRTRPCTAPLCRWGAEGPVSGEIKGYLNRCGARRLWPARISPPPEASDSACSRIQPWFPHRLYGMYNNRGISGLLGSRCTGTIPSRPSGSGFNWLTDPTCTHRSTSSINKLGLATNFDTSPLGTATRLWTARRSGPGSGFGSSSRERGVFSAGVAVRPRPVDPANSWTSRMWCSRDNLSTAIRATLSAALGQLDAKPPL